MLVQPMTGSIGGIPTTAAVNHDSSTQPDQPTPGRRWPVAQRSSRVRVSSFGGR